jgi:hypothetical protein
MPSRSCAIRSTEMAVLMRSSTECRSSSGVPSGITRLTSARSRAMSRPGSRTFTCPLSTRSMPAPWCAPVPGDRKTCPLVKRNWLGSRITPTTVTVNRAPSGSPVTNWPSANEWKGKRSPTEMP